MWPAAKRKTVKPKRMKCTPMYMSIKMVRARHANTVAFSAEMHHRLAHLDLLNYYHIA